MEDKAKTCSKCRWWEGNDMHPSLFGIPCLTVFERFGPESTWTYRSIGYQMATTRLIECETAHDFSCDHWEAKNGRQT